MSLNTNQPEDAQSRRSAPVVICYEVDQLPAYDQDFYQQAKTGMTKTSEVVVPPSDAACFEVPAGHLFRICSVDGPQVGDLNLGNTDDISERFFSGKPRQLHASHVTTGDRLWSGIPGMRPLATITEVTLEWYGWDANGAGVHDVIGTQ